VIEYWIQVYSIYPETKVISERMPIMLETLLIICNIAVNNGEFACFMFSSFTCFVFGFALFSGLLVFIFLGFTCFMFLGFACFYVLLALHIQFF